MNRLRSIVIPVLLVVFAAAVYVPRLQDTPNYLSGDEVRAALSAHSVASTGRDEDGQLLLLKSRVWFQPILVYGIAFTLKVLPFSEGTIRLPMALFGVIDVLLMYLIGKRLFRREPFAIGAAVLLALTPAHFFDSRLALEFQTPLPFILGWLLCLLIYLDRGRRSWLFAAGLVLGIGLYSYIAAYMLMPIYALLTCGVLYKRREPLNRYAALAAGFVVPALWCAVIALQNAAAVSSVLGYYGRDGQHESVQIAGAIAPSPGLAIFRHLAFTGRVYGSFLSPRLLFIYGSQSLTLRGMFLLPVAGLLVAALLRAVHRPALDILLILGGLLSAPLPASFVGQPEAIHRVAAMLPFGVLFAMMGLEYMWTAETPRARMVAFVAAWGAAIGLTVMYRADLLRGQAMIRASTVPLAVTGLAVLMRHFTIDWRKVGQAAIVAFAALSALRIAYVVVDDVTVIRASVVLLAAISLTTLLTGPSERLGRRPLLVVTLLAVMSSVFMYVYVDHTNIPRVPWIRASVVVLAVRFICPAAPLAAVLMLAKPLTVDRVSRGLAPAAILILVFTEVAYFHIDYFADWPRRFFQATAVLAGVFSLALLHRRSEVGRLGLGQITAAALFAFAATQFAYFYANYFPQFAVHRDVVASEAHVAFETAIERVRNRVVPAVYLGNVDELNEKRWKFYAIKAHRSDLLSRTLVDLEFTSDRVGDLPAGSLVIVGRSTEIDATIDRMVTSGQLRADVLSAPDGLPGFWVLERGDH